MGIIAAIAWGEMFGADPPIAEALVRGTLVYFGLLVVLRIIPRRQLGSVGLTDVLLLVLLSEAASAALNLQSKSVTVSLVTVATLAFWNFALDWAAFRWTWVAKALEPRAVPLVRDGRPLRDNMARERITDDELTSQLRQQGVADVGDVATACIESGGQVSVVKKEDAGGQSGVREPAPAGVGEVPDFAALTRDFVAAARRLQDGIAWHERRAADHARAAKTARAALAAHGVRPRRPRTPTPAQEPAG